jgi:uncharacterized protein
MPRRIKFNLSTASNRRQIRAASVRLPPEHGGQATPVRSPPLCITIRIYALRYEWAEEKTRQNQRKHGGISFEMAALVFDDPRCLAGLDRGDDAGEQRWHGIGAIQIDSSAPAVLLVVHAYREDRHGEEVDRIISARRAETHEIRRYQEQEMD